MKIRLIGIAAMVAALALGACGKDKAEEGKADKTSSAAQEPAATTGSRPPPGEGDMGKPSQPVAKGGADDAVMARARQIFAMQCQHCHGPGGRGDGPMAQRMNPGPRDYGSKEWQQSVTDERIAEVIVKGGQGTGLNPMMPANPTLASQPELLDAMVKLIRSFAVE